jgi:hypothetical protein
VQLVDGIPGMKAYFAETVQDLTGLDSNILTKLRECSGFITVMHPRGTIARPNGSDLTRASVWIEQEIAIATYISQTEKRSLPVIAFRHTSVGLEGIRGVIQLNPIEFTQDEEVLEKLPGLLEPWKTMAPADDIRPEVKSSMPIRQHDGHAIRQLLFTVFNDGNSRIREISGKLKIPEGILAFPLFQLQNQLTADGRYRVFRFDEVNVGVIQPNSPSRTLEIDYCKECAVDIAKARDPLGHLLVDEYLVEITVWVEGEEYHSEKTMKQLLDAAGR